MGETRKPGAVKIQLGAQKGAALVSRTIPEPGSNVKLSAKEYAKSASNCPTVSSDY